MWRRALGTASAGAVMLSVSAFSLAPLAGARAQQTLPPELRVVVLVVDGLRPGEIDPVRMPNVAAFRSTATSYEQSRSVMTAETIPNHVAMMTGVYPDRSGIPSNEYWDRSSPPRNQTLEDPAKIEAPTLFTTLASACPGVSTAAVLSKRYLYNVFGTGGINVAPGSSWRPEPLIANDFAPAVFAGPPIDAAISAGADLLLVNFGDVDRAGHVDESGPVLAENGALRTAAKAEVDAVVGDVMGRLRADARWSNTVVFVLSDHGFDWAAPTSFVNPQSVLDANPATAGRFFTVTAGSTAPIYLLDPAAPDAEAVLAAARATLLSSVGVADVFYTRPNSLDPDGVVPEPLGLGHPNAGDLILLASTGYRTSSPQNTSNPLPGNHGNSVTRQNTFMIGGGATYLAAAKSVAASAPDPGNRIALPEQSENVDVAPTVAWLFGLDTAGYDGRVLTEAFSAPAPTAVCGEAVSAAALSPRASGETGTNVGALPATGANPLVPIAFGAVLCGCALWILRRRAVGP